MTCKEEQKRAREGEEDAVEGVAGAPGRCWTRGAGTPCRQRHCRRRISALGHSPMIRETTTLQETLSAATRVTVQAKNIDGDA